MAKCAMMLLGMVLPLVLEAKKNWDLAINFKASHQACITNTAGQAYITAIIAMAKDGLVSTPGAFTLDSLSISNVQNAECATTAPTPAPTPAPTAAPTPAPNTTTTAAPTPATTTTTPIAAPTPAPPTPAPNTTTTAPTAPTPAPPTAAPTPAPTPFACPGGVGLAGCVSATVSFFGVADAQTKATLENSPVLIPLMTAAIAQAFTVTISDFSIVATEGAAPTPAPTAPSPAPDADAAETARFGFIILASTALLVGSVCM